MVWGLFLCYTALMQGNQSEFLEDTIMDKVVVYIHGKGGNAGEAEHYKPLFHDCDVT